MINSHVSALDDVAFDLERLLACPTVATQVSYLGDLGLLSEDGLSELLSSATELTSRDPAQARRLALICENVAGEIGASLIAARAAYIRARTHLLNAEFDIALDLIANARQGFQACGKALEAMRTYVGQIHVLQQLGRYSIAVRLGQQALSELAASAAPEKSHITAMVYQNLGVCYREMGQYDDALDAYAQAEDLYRALAESEGMGSILNNRGHVLLDLGRAAEALVVFKQAAHIFAQAEFSIELANATNNMGYAHLLLGEATFGLAAYERARDILQPLEASAEKQALLLDVAEGYLSLNLYPEALSAYREVNAALQSSGMLHERARALWGLGTVLTTQSEWDEAEQALATSAALFQQAGNLPALSMVMLDQAGLSVASGDRPKALALAQAALAQITPKHLPLQQTQAHLRIAQLLFPDAQSAQTHLLAARDLIDVIALPSLRQILLRQMGHVQRLLGHTDEAEHFLRQAITAIEQERATLVQERLRVSFLHDKLGAYDDLILISLERDNGLAVQQACQLTERARSRSLVDRMIQKVPPQTDAHRSAMIEWVAQERALQVQLHTIYNGLLRGGATDEEQAELHNQAIQVEQQLSRLQLQRQTSALDSPQKSVDTLLPLSDIQKYLPDHGLLLSYYIIEDQIFVFGIAQTRETAVRVARLGHISVVHTLLDRLALQWERFSESTDFVTRNMQRMVLSTQTVLAELYIELIQPIRIWLDEAMLSNANAVLPLVIVPHGPLHQIPFHALFDGAHYLIDFCELSYVPSIAVMALCQQRRATTLRQPLVLGLPDWQIPLAAQEAQMVADALSAKETLLGESATLAAFYERAPVSDVIHLACHGLFRDDNPLFSSLKLYDGWLMAADIAALNLNDTLVTLSACESGRSHVAVGDETMGLVRAFLSAGASTLLASLWLAHDRATTELMSLWYEAVRLGTPLSQALRLAQITLKYSHPHPFYWAPFVLVGKR